MICHFKEESRSKVIARFIGKFSFRMSERYRKATTNHAIHRSRGEKILTLKPSRSREFSFFLRWRANEDSCSHCPRTPPHAINKEEKKKEKIDQDFRCHQDNFCKSSTVEEKSVAVNYSSGNF
jgi:hypothetical protein